MRVGFAQTSLDPPQGFHTFTSEVPLPRPRQNWFGCKTVLNTKRILHDPLQPFSLSFRHARNLLNSHANRKPKLICFISQLPKGLLMNRLSP
jgi:hypothetical protein